MTSPTAQRKVAVERAPAERGCLYCLSPDGPFESIEHVIPRRLGPATDRYVLDPGAVCDPCNHWLGGQVDAPFTHRFDVALSCALEELRDRRGRIPTVIEGRDATARLDVELDGGHVTIFAARADATADGGLDIEIRLQRRDPPDVVARTIRALWKIALGCAWGARGRDYALDPRWDDLRRAVLGAPFGGYLLQAPFEARVTRRLEVNVELESAERPDAITLAVGGVMLAAGARITRAVATRDGWEIYTTDSSAPDMVPMRLDPSAP